MNQQEYNALVESRIRVLEREDERRREESIRKIERYILAYIIAPAPPDFIREGLRKLIGEALEDGVKNIRQSG